jgi:adenosylhomocysteine nucleosidase
MPSRNLALTPTKHAAFLQDIPGGVKLGRTPAPRTMTRTAFIAAFPGELKPFVRGWPHSTRNGVYFWAQRNEEEEWIAACAGAGQPAATRAFAAIEDGGPIDLVFSLGWAGALTPALKPGHAYSAAGVIDSRTGERFNCEAGAGPHWLVTSPTVADHAEKIRLAAAYPAALVDMEAAAIARLAAMREIPFYCIKGVSDSLDAKLPDFNRFLSPSGQLETAQLILHAAFRPWHWPALIRMGENSSKASQSIARSVVDLLDAAD